MPLQANSDNGKHFKANLWQDMHKELGTIVSYSPIYRPAAVGHIERQHRELKTGIRAVLVEMAETHQEDWMSILPWTVLGRNTTFQPDLGASPAELAFGCEPRLPGDVAVSQEEPLDVPKLLAELRANAAKKPVETALHTKPKPYFPPAAQNAELVWTKRQKRTPLDPLWDGPYPIVKKLGKSCLKMKVGMTVAGHPRTQVVHWSNCKPAEPGDLEPAQRPALGRPAKTKHDTDISPST